MSTAVTSATSAGTFSYVERSTTDGVADDIVGVAAPDTGRQVIAESGASGTDVFDLRLVDGVVYFRGNEAAVVDQLGVPAAKASQDARRWVTIRRTDTVYKTFEAGITTKSNLSQLPSTFVPLSSAAVPDANPPTTRIAGGISAGKGRSPLGVAVLDVAASSSLPMSFNASAVDPSTGASISLAWTFSHWRERVHVTVPAKTVPYSSLGATPPSSSRG